MAVNLVEMCHVCFRVRRPSLRSRPFSTAPSLPAKSTSKAWHTEYKGPQNLILKERPLPVITRPDGVLVKVRAASVNPIDCRMSEGYGRNILQLYNSVDSAARCKLPRELPSVLGRDFSGVIAAVGPAVGAFRPGDEVYGAVKAIDDGTHAEHLVTDTSSISVKPANLTHIEAASIPYALLTFISAVDPLSCADLKNKRVVLNGGGGGISTLAVQYLKALGCEVTVCTSPRGRPLVESLNPHHTLDYTSDSFEQQLRQLSGFDLGFDCVGDDTAVRYIKPGGRFVTVVSPLLPDADAYGLVGGAARSALSLADKVQSAWFKHGVVYHWGYFMPSGRLLEEITRLVEAGQIRPVIDQVYPFDAAPDAYGKVAKGQGLGKTVIDMDPVEAEG